MGRAFLLKWLPRLALYLFVPAVAVVSWGELSSAPSAIEAHYWDKALHFMAYFGLSGILCVALKADRRVLTSTLLIALFGGVLEVLQGFTGRDPDITDAFANILGVVTGAGIGWVILWLIRPKSLAVGGRS